MLESVTKADCGAALEQQTVRLTVRPGGIVAICAAILATIVKP